jgi:hypothetical protein
VEEARGAGRLSFSSTRLAFTSMVGGPSLAGAAEVVLPDDAGALSPRSMRWSSAVASTS